MDRARWAPWIATALLLAACSAEDDALVCVPGTVDLCFDGPLAVRDVGACHAGRRTCNDDGSGYGPCIRQRLPQVERCDTPEDESCDGEARCTGTVRWAERFGDAHQQTVERVSPIGAGGMLVGGRIDGVVDFGAAVLPASGQPGPYLAAFADDGALGWARLFGSAKGTTTISSAFADADGNVFAAGWFEGATDLGDGAIAATGGVDAFVLALDARGAVRWKKILGGAGDQRAWVGPPDARGELVVTAVWSGRLDFGDAVLESAFADPAQPDLAVVRCDPQGSVRWATSFSGDVQPFAASGFVTPVPAVIGADGRVFAATAGGAHVALDGLAFDAPGSNLVTWLIELDAGGAFGWSARLDGLGHRVPAGVALAPDGGVVVTTGAAGWVNIGFEQLSIDNIQVARFGPEGELGWHSQIAVSDPGGGAAVDGAGNILVTGHTSFGGVTFHADDANPWITNGQFVAKLSPKGEVVWFRDIGYGIPDARVAADATGGVRLAGNLAGSILIGGTYLENASPPSSDPPTDIFVIATAP